MRTATSTISSTSRPIGAIPPSAACCPKERPLPSACRSSATAGRRASASSRATPWAGCRSSREPLWRRRESTDGDFARRSGSAMRKLFIVSCTRGRKEETDLYRSLRKLGADCFLFIENNRKGVSTCYNRILDEKSGRDEIVIFVHDDVTIGDLFLQEKITAAFDQENYAIAGLAGTSDFKIRPDAGVISWFQPPAEAWSGAVETHLPDGSTIMSAFGPTPKRSVVLDGLFLAIDLRKIGHVRFEEQLAFHFYDLDFCLTAHLAGLSLGTTNIYVTHR